MPAIPREKIQAAAYLKDPTHAREVKDTVDVDSSDSIATITTKKRKKGDRSGAKRLKMSSSMETLSPASIHSKTSKGSHKESKRNKNKTKSAVSHEMLSATPSEFTGFGIPLKLSSDQKVSKQAASTTPTNPFELTGLPASEFIYPRDLGLFDCSSEESEPSYEPVSEYLPEQRNEIPTPYTPVLRAVSQYNQRAWSKCGSVCETWLARQMYEELDDISTRIGNIMRGIKGMLEEKEAMDNCDDFDGFDGFDGFDNHFEDGDTLGPFNGSGPGNPLELSGGEDGALFVSSDERAYSGEKHARFGESSGSGDE
ncbi:uncharacterized protein N7479_004559 [Penicillium vulpinum]|uniref:Uncharacterized protein n=1 Tax=Penicillium vulpinum TaxID=29845 RepID=A0A1V6RRP3_9EURO|nr:uncharacterized protein N7479_004559 [Penicillium vulpinum]KAJ5964683.1 hypothetical protein N7479_004559 [Penicillium vulpinum]OQE04306.1 hypothetical protein PENVUL_c034G08061 [Penicillium vulpinum]